MSNYSDGLISGIPPLNCSSPAPQLALQTSYYQHRHYSQPCPRHTPASLPARPCMHSHFPVQSPPTATLISSTTAVHPRMRKRAPGAGKAGAMAGISPSPELIDDAACELIGIS